MDRASGFVFQVKGTFHTPKEDYDETNCYYDRCHSTCRYDTDGDGICDHAGQGQCFVDENGDGICDNRGTGCHGNGWGCRE